MSWWPLLSRAATFQHGIHPAEHKDATSHLPIERMPFAAELVLPLGQHIGAPCKAVVSAGQRVERGQLIAEPGGFVSTALHAPVTGTVKAVELRRHPNGQETPAIVLRTDPLASQRLATEAPQLPPSGPEVAKAIQLAGIVGLGGAAFPAHVKLSVPQGKQVRSVLLNGCECEPYLTCDHRVMLERPAEVVLGLRLVMAQVGAQTGYIGVEANKPDAIAALRQACQDDPALQVVELQVKYPQGAEKMLIEAVLGQEVPSGKLPLDLGLVVQNVATAVSLAELFGQGKPLIERVVTVTGPGVRRPANVVVPIGTPLRALLDHCGGLLPEAQQVILGGPMMGLAQKSLDAPVTKGVSGVLVLNEPARVADELPCIRCGRCLQACPMRLNPQRLALMVRHERPDDLVQLNVADCFECGSCSFSCPSNLPLVQLMRVGKAMVRQRKVKS